jgi:DNA-binding NtrC family response regulator
VPVIYMARSERLPSMRETLQQRAAVVLPKPYSTDHLVGALETACAGLLRRATMPHGVAC